MSRTVHIKQRYKLFRSCTPSTLTSSPDLSSLVKAPFAIDVEAILNNIQLK